MKTRMQKYINMFVIILTLVISFGGCKNNNIDNKPPGGYPLEYRIDDDGSLWVWGGSVNMGDGVHSVTDNRRGYYVAYNDAVKIMNDVAIVYTNDDFYCYFAIKTDDSLWAWGGGSHQGNTGELRGTGRKSGEIPIKVMDDVASVEITTNYIMILKPMVASGAGVKIISVNLESGAMGALILGIWLAILLTRTSTAMFL